MPRIDYLNNRRGVLLGTRLIAVPMLLLAAGCATSGPVTVRGDRFNFNQVGAQSTNEQILLNIVRLRYGEPIYFVEIGSMLSHYSLAAGGKIGGWRNNINTWESPALNAVYGQDNVATRLDSWEANLEYSDSPTITYAPLSGDEFASRVMARIPLGTILDLAGSGWDVERLLECCVQRLNNLSNKSIHGARCTPPATFDRFHKAAQLLQAAQDADLLRFNIEVEADRQAAYLYPPPMPESWQDKRKQFRELLDLPVGEYERLKVTTNAVKREPDELAMQTRSVLGTMYALSQEINVPDDHLEKCQPAAAPAVESEQAAPSWLRVSHSRLPQAGAFVQVHYRGYWFFVDDADWSSKRTLSLLTYLFSLQSTAKGQVGPLLTVPAGK